MFGVRYDNSSRQRQNRIRALVSHAVWKNRRELLSKPKLQDSACDDGLNTAFSAGGVAKHCTALPVPLTLVSLTISSSSERVTKMYEISLTGKPIPSRCDSILLQRWVMREVRDIRIDRGRSEVVFGGRQRPWWLDTAQTPAIATRGTKRGTTV